MATSPIHRESVSLFGFQTANFVASVTQQWRDGISIFGDNSHSLCNARPLVEFEVGFVLDRSSTMELRDTIRRLEYMGAFTITRLGDTQICQCCNAAMRPGRMTCHRCGAPYTAIVKNSKYDRVGHGYITAMDTEIMTSVFDNYARTRLAFLMDELTVNEGGLRHAFDGWCTTHIKDGWICWYCKSVNQMQATECHYCGGGRLPFSDLERIASKCLYCGTKLKSGAVCDGCGSAQNGYSVWPPRYDW